MTNTQLTFLWVLYPSSFLNYAEYSGIHGGTTGCSGIHGRAAGCSGIHGRTAGCSGIHGGTTGCSII